MERMALIALENLWEFVLFFDGTGFIHYANQQANDLLEYEDVCSSCKISDIFQNEIRIVNGKVDIEALTLGDYCDYNAYRKNLTCFPVAGKIVVVDSDAMIYGFIGYDATERVYLTKQNEKAEAEVETALRVRSEFVANITHELRTPVNGILGNTRELVDIEDDPQKKKYLSLIERGCADMNSIINNILDFSKLDAGKFTLESREFVFRDMIEYVQSTHKNKIAEKGVDFLVSISPDIPEKIVGDELRIVQILNNLLSNAAKFTSVGRIVLEALKTSQIGNRMELFFLVIDTGIGISKEGQDKLFKSFSQVDASISRRFGGTGLGLNIAKQLVEMMDGSIQVESEPGKGSMFSFHIWVELPQGSEGQDMTMSASEQEAAMSEYHDIDANAELFVFGSKDNVEEINKKMQKLILSVEMDNWEKAEMFMEAVRKLLENGPEDVKRGCLRLKMAVQKADHDKTVDAYEKLQALL